MSKNFFNQSLRSVVELALSGQDENSRRLARDIDAEIYRPKAKRKKSKSYQSKMDKYFEGLNSKYSELL